MTNRNILAKAAPAYDFETITSVPTPEVARWGARIDRMNLAISNNHRISLGSFSDDGVIEWKLAEKALKGEEWQTGVSYEDAIIYELKPGISYNSVVGRAAEDSEPAESYHRDKTGQMAYRVGRIAAREGLRRLGLWSEADNGGVAIPLGVVAALCFSRADIEEATDRKLFDRKDEIRLAVKALTEAVRPRGLKVRAQNKTNGQQVAMVPLYYQAPWLEQEQYAAVGLDPENSLNAWWQELNRDLARIDEASGNL